MMRALVDHRVAVELLTEGSHAGELREWIDLCRERDVPVYLYAATLPSVYTALEETVGAERAALLFATLEGQFNWWSSLAADCRGEQGLSPAASQLLRAFARMGDDALLLTLDEQVQNAHEHALSPADFIARLKARGQESEKIAFVDLGRQLDQMRPGIEDAVHRVMNATAFINGADVHRLEEELADFVGVEHALGCSSGTDALTIAMMALDVRPGDEVIVPDFTYIATAETVALLGAVPVFADVRADTYNIDAAHAESLITDRTVGIVPVSLYGQPADMEEINAVGQRHGLWVMEDAAQSFGATYRGKPSCSLTFGAGTSFFPAKPLGCYGDGGAIFTNDGDFASRMRRILNHGQRARYDHAVIGINGRLDTVQAAILRTKLERFPEEIENRQAVAGWYSHALAGAVELPTVLAHNTSVWAQYTIRVEHRDQVREELASRGIPTSVHYPIPLHAQDALAPYVKPGIEVPVSRRVSAEVLSLPMHPFLKKREVQRISDAVQAAVGE